MVFWYLLFTHDWCWWDASFSYKKPFQVKYTKGIKGWTIMKFENSQGEI